MPSTYANNLRLENIANGEQSGSWGDTTNKNICSLLVDSIAGIVTTSITGLTTYTLSAYNGVTDESRMAVLRYTGNISAACTIYIPAVGKTYLIDNYTNLALTKQNLLIRTGAGAVAATVPFGIYTVYCDGLDTFISTGFAAGGTVTGNLAITGNETITGTLGVTGTTTLATTLTGALVGTAGVVSAVAPGTAGNLLTSNGTAWASTANAPAFPAGTRMSFQQTLAPTGWTKDTTAAINDSILRFVTGSVTPSGGSVAFSTWNAQVLTGATAITTAQMPAHTHNVGNQQQLWAGQGAPQASYSGMNTGIVANQFPTITTGGGGSHDHALTHGVKYYDFIIASKDA